MKVDRERSVWTAAERAVFDPLRTPEKIQLFLNRLAYDPVPGTASPRRALKERKANCFEGAMLAAATGCATRRSARARRVEVPG